MTKSEGPMTKNPLEVKRNCLEIEFLQSRSGAPEASRVVTDTTTLTVHGSAALNGVRRCCRSPSLVHSRRDDARCLAGGTSALPLGVPVGS